MKKLSRKRGNTQPMAYLPHNDKDIRDMMKKIGISSIDELFKDIPDSIRTKGLLKLPEALPETSLLRHMRDLSRQNKNVEDDYACFLGAGAYDHFIPGVVAHVTGRSEFYTAYTPYQPELSQGVLQAMFEYQSLICDITGMDVSNASLYDGATAVVEAANVSRLATKRDKIIVSRLLHPEYMTVLKTYAAASGLDIIEIDQEEGTVDLEKATELVDEKTAGLIIQNPNFFGHIENLTSLAQIAHAKGCLLIAVVYPISLGLLKLPGECGADIVVGEGQSLGIPLSFGGPYLGLFACRANLTRLIPGRVVGMTRDKAGKQGYVLTLQTREQHIRREKAGSNICSNEALCALSAAVYLSSLGKQGFRRVAELCVTKAHYLAQKLSRINGFSLRFPKPFFNEFVITVGEPAKKTKRTDLIENINKKLFEENIIGGLPLGKFYPEMEDSMLFAVTEKRTKAEMDKLTEILSNIKIA
jgi:glycine dehydrogenase subunit 1